MNNKRNITFENDYVRKQKIQEKKETYIDKTFETMNKEARLNFLESFLSPNEFIENSSNIIINKSRKKFQKRYDKGNYEEVNKTYDKLLNMNFFNEIIGSRDKDANEMLHHTLKFNDLNNQIHHSNQKGGSNNESLYSLKEAYNYFNEVKNKNGRMHVLDLETIGGTNTEGIWQPEAITEFSLQTWDFKNNKRSDKTFDIVLGLDSNESLLNEVITAIDRNTITSNNRLNVTASRLSLYGHKDTKIRFDENLGYYVLDSFADTKLSQPKNIEAVKDGWKVLTDIAKDMEQRRIASGTTIRADHAAMAQAMKLVDNDISTGMGLLAGQNHVIFDMPILQNEFRKLNNVYGGNNFKLDFGYESNKMLDLLGFTNNFLENFSATELYPKGMKKDIKTIAGQEGLIAAHLPTLANQLTAHKAADDVYGLMGLLAMPSEQLKDNQSLLDFMATKLNTVKHTDTALTSNKHILRAKTRTTAAGGMDRGYFNFASNSKGEIFTNSNHIISNGNVSNEGFNVGYGVNKGAFYNLNNIREIELTEELQNIIGDFTPEFAGQKMYHVELQMETAGAGKNSRLEDLTQNIFFKSKKELEAFMSRYFDVIGEKDLDGSIKEIYKDQIDKIDIRELKTEAGRTNASDVNANHKKNTQELYESAVEFQNKKLLTSRAENTFLRESDYDKLNKALKIESEILDLFKEAGQQKSSLSQREINTIMSAKVASGQMPMGLNKDVLEKMQNVIKSTLVTASREKSLTQQLLDSSVDNYSSIMDFVDRNRTVLSNIMNELNKKFDGNNNISKEYKREAFARVYDAVKRDTASYIHRNSVNTSSREASYILNDVKLQTSLDEFKNMFEIDLSPISKSKNSYIGTSSPENLSNLLKLDISSKSATYRLVDNAVEMIFGKNKNTEEHKDKAMSDLFDILKNNHDFKNTNAIRNFKSKYIDKETGSLKEGTERIGYHIMSNTVVDAMRELKAKDRFAGIENIDYAFMKSLQGHDSFIKALNSEKRQEGISDIVNEVVDNLNVNIISSGKREGAEVVVQKELMKHYMPNLTKEKYNSLSDPAKMLYNKGYEEMQTYLTNLVQSLTSIKDTSISIQNNGALLVRHKGLDAIPINNIPRIKLDDDSGVMYMQIGSQKFQYYQQAQLTSSDYNIKGDIGTTLNRLNQYDNNFLSNLEDYVGDHGTEAGIDKVLGRLRGAVNDLREMPTINNFGGNDLDSNNLVEIQTGLKNILYDLFANNGRHNRYINNVNFMDKNLHTVLAEKLSKAKVDDNNRLENLSPDVIRDVIKDVGHIMQQISRGEGATPEFKKIMKDISFSAQEKKTANVIGYYGETRPHNSAYGSYDNPSRPTVTQAGNAKFLRVNDIENSSLTAGNLIETPYMKERAWRHFEGIGNTTTDVMMDISYVSTDALDILLKSNFDEVIEKSSVNFGTEEAARKAYSYVKNSINTYEQERVMDSRVHEKVYGLQTANTQKLSSTVDLMSYLNNPNTSDKDFNKQAQMLKDHLGNVSIDSSGNLKYTSSAGLHVKKGDSILKSEGFAGLSTSFSSKMQHGIFNFNFYNSNEMKLRDSEISEIINSNRHLFVRNNNLISENEMPSVLINLLNKNDIKSQWAVEDIAALGYAKTMTSGAEKGMTDILYATTGQYNKEVKQVFKNLNMWENVNSKVLTNEAIDAITHNALSQGQMIFAGTNFKSIDDLKQAIKQERHMHSEMLFGIALGNKTHMLANDNVVGHANFGAMYQGSLSKAIDLIAKKNNNNTEIAVQTIVDLINNNNDFKFMKNWNLSKEGISLDDIGVFKNEYGRLEISNDFLTKTNEVSSLNSTKYNQLLKHIDENYLGGTNDDNSLVRKDVWMYKKDDEGNEVLQEVKEIVGAFKSTTLKDGRTLLLGAQTKENVKYVTDVETQTGVTDEYFTLKRHTTDLKKEKIDLEATLNITEDAKVRSKLTKELNGVKNKLRKAEEELIPYEGTVKITRLGDQELSILSRVTITQSHVDRMNELMDAGDIDENLLNIDSFRNRIVLRDNVLVGTNDINLSLRVQPDREPEMGKGVRVLDRFIDKVKRNQWYDEINDVELTEDILKMDEYSHLGYIYRDLDSQNILLGIDKAENIHQARSSFEAMKFNKGIKSQESIDELADFGFKVKHINDVNFDTDKVVKENLIIDLGEEYAGASKTSRYIAVPGTGKVIGDEQIRKKVHSDLASLQRRYTEYMDVHGSSRENIESKLVKVKSKVEDVMQNIESDLLDKNAMVHSMSKVDVTTATYRNKLSGVMSSEFNNNFIEKAMGKGITTIDSSNSELTRKALIEGRSIADWEKNGTYFDYTFVSMKQMSDMGYFKEDTLKQFNMTKEEMIEHLKVHGTTTIYDRYPNTKTGSMALTRTFLDEGLADNQMKISITVAGKSNADHDGDSATNFIDRYVDRHNRSVDAAYYHKVKELAKEDLRMSGVEETADSLKEAVLKAGKIEEEDYDYFLGQETYFASQAATDNKKWAKWGHETIVKDNIKNVKTSDMRHASTVADGYSDLFSNNVFSYVSQISSLKDFNDLETQSNELIQEAQKLYSEMDIDFALLKGKKDSKAYLDEQKAWQTFMDTKDIRENGSAQTMDKVMAIFETAKSKDIISEETLNIAKSASIRKVTQDKYVQETVIKTGLASVGNVNLALNSIKLTTQILEKDNIDKVRFTNFIWDTLDQAEQKIISDKKSNKVGFDDEKVTGFSNAIKDAYSPNSAKRESGVNDLMDWIDENAKGTFKTAFEDYGRDLFSKEEYLQILENKNGEEKTRELFKKYIKSTSEDDLFTTVNASFDAVGKNGSHARNLELASAFVSGETEYRSLKSTSLRNILGSDENAREQYEALLKIAEDNASYNTKIKNSEEAIMNANAKEVISQGISQTAESAMKHTPRIPMSGNGLGMAMLGTAAGLMISGYASGNPLKDKSAEQVSGEQQAPKQTMSVPQFMEQGGMVTGNNQGGYVINLQADTKKGKKYMKRMMAQAAEASVGGAVSVNMNLKDMSRNGITDRDIESFMDRHL